MFGLLRPRPTPADAFFARYRGRSLLVHCGFEPEWLPRLLNLPGGAGHFRIDARRCPARGHTPVEWLVREHLLPLELPLPLLVKIGERELWVRHATRGGNSVDPSEIGWLLDEIEARHHARLHWSGSVFTCQRGMAVADNDIDYDFSL